MAASQYHFNGCFSISLQWLLLNITSLLLIGVVKVLKSYNRISVETFSIQILFFKNLYNLNSKSKENFLNIEVYGGFYQLLFCVFLRTRGIV